MQANEPFLSSSAAVNTDTTLTNGSQDVFSDRTRPRPRKTAWHNAWKLATKPAGFTPPSQHSKIFILSSSVIGSITGRQNPQSRTHSDIYQGFLYNQNQCCLGREVGEEIYSDELINKTRAVESFIIYCLQEE